MTFEAATAGEFTGVQNIHLTGGLRVAMLET